MTLFPSVDGICRAMKARFFSLNTVGLTPTEWLSILRAEAAAKAQNK